MRWRGRIYLAILLPISLGLCGCRATQEVTITEESGANAIATEVRERRSAPKPIPLPERNVRQSQPEKVTLYEKPVPDDVPTLEIYGIEIKGDEVVIHAADRDITTKNVAQGETKYVRFDSLQAQNAYGVTEVVKGEPEETTIKVDVPRQKQRGFFGEIGNLIKWLSILVGLLVIAWVVNFLKNVLEDRRRDEKLDDVVDMAHKQAKISAIKEASKD